MNQEQLMALLEAYRTGAAPAEAVLAQFQKQPFEDAGFVKIDTHRDVRQGVGEVIFGQNKTPEQIREIALRMMDAGRDNILISRLSAEAAAALQDIPGMEYHALPRVGIVNRKPPKHPHGHIAVVSAGTADMAVCEEAALTAEVLGNRVTRIYDVGVAGLHRLLARLDQLLAARVLIVVAGMEGALPSVVGGLVSSPVIAVPTSVGYGAAFGGLAALLSMLNSCASGVSVVNLDHGVGAAYQATRINRMGECR
ncbi:MAG: nickel pincer cofactor biosynthesis protein LarB [Candidatus Limiplasma sp.]|nr:nickel pincer cofactor biosynthesis protein LarB [Candidatus Limiplasma sp.]